MKRTFVGSTAVAALLFGSFPCSANAGSPPAPTGWTATVAGQILFLQDDGSHGCSALVDGDTTAFDGCFLGAQGALEVYYSVFPAVRPEFIVFDTAWESNFPAFFYSPSANDVHGIGYRNLTGGTETFGDPSGRGLSGFLFMNTPTALGTPGTAAWLADFDGVWSQELAHRWGAFVHYIDPDTGEERDDHLDDYKAHWRFPFDSDGSAMGGMNWLDNHDGTFTSDPTFFEAWTYSSLDLYLMGLIPATSVSPFFLIREPLPDYGQWGPLPATENPVTLSGKKIRLTVDDIISAEGPRDPAWQTAPRAFHAPHVVVLRAEDDLAAAIANPAFEMQRARASETFSRQTHGLAYVHTALDVPPANQKPQAEIAPVEGAVEGRSAELDASPSVDPEGRALSFVWDFGDGSGAWSEEPRIEHTFRRSGELQVTVVAVDDRGGFDLATSVVDVAKPEAGGCTCQMAEPTSRTTASRSGMTLAGLAVAAAFLARRRCH